MRQTQTAVLERQTVFRGTFATEPYETAWAGEARWFVRVGAISAGARLRLQAQVSPDGLEWVDHEASAFQADDRGLVSQPLRDFGSWLRLRGELEGTDAEIEVTIYLVLKA